MAHYLEPLAIAANITQASFCRIDQVLLTFGYLITKYSEDSMGHDKTAQSAIINSLERRWWKCDQEVFIAAVILNPYYQLVPFRKDDSLIWIAWSEMLAMFRKLYKRFFNHDAPADFDADLNSFLKRKDRFRTMTEHLDSKLREANEAVRVL